MSEQVFHPTIAQLAERETVEAKQLSLGHWFESGSRESFENFPCEFESQLHNTSSKR